MSDRHRLTIAFLGRRGEPDVAFGWLLLAPSLEFAALSIPIDSEFVIYEAKSGPRDGPFLEEVVQHVTGRVRRAASLRAIVESFTDPKQYGSVMLAMEEDLLADGKSVEELRSTALAHLEACVMTSPRRIAGRPLRTKQQAVPAAVLPFRRPDPQESEAQAQAHAALAWIEKHHRKAATTATGWHYLTDKAKAIDVRGRMDDEGRSLGLDTMELDDWIALMPGLEHRALQQSLAETHRFLNRDTIKVLTAPWRRASKNDD